MVACSPSSFILLSVIFFAVCVAGGVGSLQQQQQQQQVNAQKESSAPTTRTELLLHFDKYILSQDAAKHASDILRFCARCVFHVQPKRNVPAGFHTDFVVVITSTPEAVRAYATKSGHFRDVSAQQKLTPRRPSEMGEGPQEEGSSARTASRRNLQQPRAVDPAQRLGITSLWGKGRGANVRVGILDTGIARQHAHFAHGNVDLCINFTDNPSCEDGHSHGTFVAGTIASSSECVGIVPEARLYIFKVFTDSQASFTSWFLDAFNHALQSELDVINFSIGGPDYMDRPFVDKINEVTASGITVVSAIGNDGPSYGTLTNPADQMDVIGVGAVTSADALATFSSRGMTLHELPYGVGRAKPDVLTYGELLRGSNAFGGCKLLSGTSVASPVVAGVVALLTSVAKSRGLRPNPGMMKQALMEGAVRLPGEVSVYEQGAGMVNPANSMKHIESFTPHLSAHPSSIDLTHCPYFDPHCLQPLFYSAMPALINLTLVSSVAATTYIRDVKFLSDLPDQRAVLDVTFQHLPYLWPWSGALAVGIRVQDPNFRGLLHGFIVVHASAASGNDTYHELRVPLLVKVVATPERSKRLLWDVSHQVHYPPAYVPRDDVEVPNELLDVLGDHPYTNMRDAFRHLVKNLGYFVDLLVGDLTTFNASLYSALILVDTEEEFYVQEVDKIRRDVEEQGLGLVIVADWYNEDLVRSVTFTDDHTFDKYDAVTGGSNVPALNDLLEPLGAAFGSRVWRGVATFESKPLPYKPPSFSSGNSILRLPPGALVYPTYGALQDVVGNRLRGTNQWTGSVPVLGFAPVKKGRLALYGDSGCWDRWHNDAVCSELIEAMISYAVTGSADRGMLKGVEPHRYPDGFVVTDDKKPVRPDGNPLTHFSPVLMASRDLAKASPHRHGYVSPVLDIGASPVRVTPRASQRRSTPVLPSSPLIVLTRLPTTTPLRRVVTEPNSPAVDTGVPAVVVGHVPRPLGLGRLAYVPSVMVVPLFLVVVCCFRRRRRPRHAGGGGPSAARRTPAEVV